MQRLIAIIVLTSLSGHAHHDPIKRGAGPTINLLSGEASRCRRQQAEQSDASLLPQF
jgi:hypothetical protein